MATKIYNGQTITLSTTEVAYELAGYAEDKQTVFITLVSGTVQATVKSASAAPVLDDSYATRSTADVVFPITIDTGVSTLRMKCASAGVVNVNW